jgi:hypothetical protein
MSKGYRWNSEKNVTIEEAIMYGAQIPTLQHLIEIGCPFDASCLSQWVTFFQSFNLKFSIPSFLFKYINRLRRPCPQGG